MIGSLEESQPTSNSLQLQRISESAKVKVYNWIAGIHTHSMNGKCLLAYLRTSCLALANGIHSISLHTWALVATHGVVTELITRVRMVTLIDIWESKMQDIRIQSMCLVPRRGMQHDTGLLAKFEVTSMEVQFYYNLLAVPLAYSLICQNHRFLQGSAKLCYSMSTYVYQIPWQEERSSGLSS